MERSSSSRDSANPALSQRSATDAYTKHGTSMASSALIDSSPHLYDPTSLNFAGMSRSMNSIDAPTKASHTIERPAGSDYNPARDPPLSQTDTASHFRDSSPTAPSAQISNIYASSQPSFGSSQKPAYRAQTEALNIDLGRPNFRSPFVPPAESEPHTPIDQIPPPPGHLPYESKARFGSVSSIATTDDDDAINEVVYPWTPQQDSIVRRMYDEIVNRPQITPFSGRYPPSGVLHRVAKDTLKMAKHEKVAFPHSINAVRRRVLVLYQPSAESLEELDKYKMSQDYFSMTPQYAPSYQPSQMSASTASQLQQSYSQHEPPEHQLARLQPNVQQPAFSRQFTTNNNNNNSGMHSDEGHYNGSGANGGDEDFEFFEAMSSNRRLSVEEKYAARSNYQRNNMNADAMPVPTLAGSANLASGFAPGLAAPFREPNKPGHHQGTSSGASSANNSSYSANAAPASGQLMLSEEDVVNIVAKRKRDSLRMKRGQF